MGLERWREMQVTVPLLPLHTLLRFAWPNYPSVMWHNDLSPSLHREWGCMRKSECDTMKERECDERARERCKWNLKSVCAPRFLPFIYCITPFMPHEALGRAYLLSRPLFLTFIDTVLVISPWYHCHAAVPASSELVWKLSSPLLSSVFVFFSSHFSTSSVSPPASAPLQQRTRIINHNQRWRLLKTGLLVASRSKSRQHCSVRISQSLSTAVWCDTVQGVKLLSSTHELIYPLSNCIKVLVFLFPSRAALMQRLWSQSRQRLSLVLYIFVYKSHNSNDFPV